MRNLTRIITPGRRFIPEVDGLRFIAIMAVVGFHLAGYTSAKAMNGAAVLPWQTWFVRILAAGSYGVPLFFVLSGFLLAMPFAKWRLGLGARPSLKAYYLRRLTRLEPPYVVAMCLLFFAGMVAWGAAVGAARWTNLLASLGYQHNLIYQQPSLINCVAWSLEIEVQFYLLAPLLAAVFSIRNVFVRRLLLLGASLILPFVRSLWSGPLSDRLSLSLPYYAEYFLVGFLLADLYLTDWGEKPIKTIAWDLATLIGWPILLTATLTGTFHPFVPIAILFCYIGAFRGLCSSWVLSRRPITVIGGMCYSIYLLHYQTISMTGHLAGHFLRGVTFLDRFAIEAAFSLPAILAVTILFYLLIEQPCMDNLWPSKLCVRFSPSPSRH
jgi:peptidoglycan/LPS O-acetylase OafA/YrhL